MREHRYTHRTNSPLGVDARVDTTGGGMYKSTVMCQSQEGQTGCPGQGQETAPTRTQRTPSGAVESKVSQGS